MDKQNVKSADKIQQGQVTVDAVHPRFLGRSKHTQNRSSSIETRDEASTAYCQQCNVNIGHTVVALRNHFESSRHESQPCVYCSGPVYRYICRFEKQFHECVLNAMQGRGPDDTSSLSQDEDSDTSEMQSVSSTQNIESESLGYMVRLKKQLSIKTISITEPDFSTPVDEISVGVLENKEIGSE